MDSGIAIVLLVAAIVAGGFFCAYLWRKFFD